MGVLTGAGAARPVEGAEVEEGGSPEGRPLGQGGGGGGGRGGPGRQGKQLDST